LVLSALQPRNGGLAGAYARCKLRLGKTGAAARPQ